MTPATRQILNANIKLSRAQGMLEGLRKGLMPAQAIDSEEVVVNIVNLLDEVMTLIGDAQQAFIDKTFTDSTY